MTLNNGTKSQSHNETWSDFVMKSMFKYYLNMRSICPPFCCTTSSTRRRHSPMRTARNMLCYATWEHPVRWARHVAAKSRFKSGWLRRVGCPAADGLPLSKFRLSRQTETSICRGMGETQPVVPGHEHRRMASSSWRRGAAEWRNIEHKKYVMFK